VHLAALCLETAEAVAGVLAGYLIASLLPRRWAFAIARPVLRAIRLRPELAHAVAAAPAGPAAVASLLARIEGTTLLELLGTVSLAVFIHGVQHWARAFVALAALLGGVGVTYSLLLLAIASARLAIVCALCTLRPRPAETPPLPAAGARLPLAQALKAALRPAATVAAAVLAIGAALDYIMPALASLVPPWLAIVGIHAASAYAAYGVVHVMLASGVMAPREALRALLVGTALSSLVGGWRRLFPQLLPLGARRAAAVTTVSQGLYAALALALAIAL
jgi:hypothetical protein